MKVSATIQNFSDLPKPKSDKADVLLTLIKNGKASIEDYKYLAGFRTRISELSRKHNLNLLSRSVTGKNRFDNTITYQEHILPENEKEVAIELYHQINA